MKKYFILLFCILAPFSLFAGETLVCNRPDDTSSLLNILMTELKWSELFSKFKDSLAKLINKENYRGWEDTEPEIQNLYAQICNHVHQSLNKKGVSEAFSFLNALNQMNEKLDHHLTTDAFLAISKSIIERKNQNENDQNINELEEYKKAKDNEQAIRQLFSHFHRTIEDWYIKEQNFSKDEIVELCKCFVVNLLQAPNQRSLPHTVVLLKSYGSVEKTEINLSDCEFNSIVERNPRVRTGGYHVPMLTTNEDMFENFSRIVTTCGIPNLFTIIVNNKRIDK